MATRKSEWLASIKPILDRDEAKKDAKELARELSDMLEINIDANPESLKQLTDEFNKQLAKMGKQPIVFSEKTLQGIVGQFANAVAEGFAKGTDTGVTEALKRQLEGLKKQRQEIVKEQNKINKTVKSRSRMEKLESFEIETARPLKVKGDAGKEAQKLVDVLYKSADQIAQAEKQYGKTSIKYRDAVLDAQEAYNEYLRMQKTLKSMSVSERLSVPKDVRASYDLLGKDRDAYEAAGGMNLPFEEDFAAEKILDAFEELSDIFENSIDQAIKFKKQLQQIDAQIDSVTKQIQEVSVTDGSAFADSKDGLKTLQEIEAAYDRISKKRATRDGHKPIDNVIDALEYTSGSATLATLRNRYNTSLSSGEDWEVQYQWLVKFVKEYENYSAQIEAETDSIKRKNIRARQKQYTALYEELKPMAENAETMLRGIIDVSGGKQPVGVKDANKQDVVAGPTPEDVANAEQIAALERQAREEAGAKAKAEAEAAEVAKQKRIEEEKAAKAAEKKRLADEAAAEAQRKVAEEAERERQAKEASTAAEKADTYTGYRAIQPPEGSHKTKHDALADWGAEYFSTDPKVAVSYGEDFFEKGDMIIGETTPKNPLIINANGLRWDEFDKMPGLKELFPGLLDLMEQPGYIGDDGQKYINEQAKLAGYDSVILENVQDALDGDIKEYGFSTTIAVLDDKIVSLTGSMAQLEAGTNRFADVISTEIPSYYTRSTGGDGSQIGNTGDASSADLEVERTKVEALQNEVEQKNKELVSKDDEIARVQAESDAAKRILDDAKTTLQNDLDETRQQLAGSEYEKGLYDSAMNQLTEESNEKDRIIYDLREQLANVKTGTGEEQASVSSEELKNVLSSIVYNVKIAHDDSDKTANKIALDESALESTLKRVFTNVLSPQTEQNDEKQGKEPWALESTLQNVKSALDQIQTNTAKIGSVEAVPSDTTGVSEVATKLTGIKAVLDSINTKIAKGGVINTRDDAKQPGSRPSKPNEKTQTARSNMMKSLINDYKTMGKLAAQFASDGNLETKAMLDNLKEEVRRKRDSLKITMDENAGLREKYSIAFDAEKRLLEAEKQQKEINDQRKADAKSGKKRFADAKKMAQREAMVGKAGNAVGRAENTWMTAVGMEDVLSKEFEAQIDDYYQKLDALRKKHQELKNSDMISDEQKKELLAQTLEINKLTDEIGGLVSEYQKLSGDNVTVIGKDKLDSDAGLDAYNQQLKQAVMTATNGKAQIKNFDAATGTLTYTVKTGAHEFTEYTAAVRRADGALVSVQGTTKKTETFFEATARKMKELTSYFSGMAVFNRIGQELRRGIQYIREIDDALVELRKVTDETEETYDRFLQTAAKTGAKLGATIAEVTEATSTFAKLGYTMEQSTEMAEAALVYKNVGDNIASTEDAADSIISTLKGFGLESSETMRIVDRFNEVGKYDCPGCVVIHN